MSHEKVIVTRFVCDRCGANFETPSFDEKDMPPGYHVHLRRVTDAGHHSVSDALFFCSKDCLLGGMQFGISSYTHPVEVFR